MNENKTTEKNPLVDYFKLSETLEFDKMVGEYVSQIGASPFKNIDMDELGKLNLDMDESFSNATEAQFGDKLDDILADYFVSMLTVMQEEMEMEMEESEEN